MDMDISEMVVFIVSAIFSITFLVRWYRGLSGVWPPERVKVARYILGFLPLAVFVMFLYTLNYLASFDVVGAFIYKTMYVLLGFTWLYLGIVLMSLWLDISWLDDVLHLNNKAALWPVIGGVLALALIYSGANIGDGPGWWCVVFAGGLGTGAWFLLALIVSKIAGASEHITVERDLPCGIRFGGFLLASGIILARASAGDWTSFGMTVVEFFDGWPALLLTVLAVIVEMLYIAWQPPETGARSGRVLSSAFCGIFYILIAIAVVVVLPALVKNPAYREAAFIMPGGLL